jgi:hypothetical protein
MVTIGMEPEYLLQETIDERRPGGTGFSLCGLDLARVQLKPHRLKPVPPATALR